MEYPFLKWNSFISPAGLFSHRDNSSPLSFSASSRNTLEFSFSPILPRPPTFFFFFPFFQGPVDILSDKPSVVPFTPPEKGFHRPSLSPLCFSDCVAHDTSFDFRCRPPAFHFPGTFHFSTRPFCSGVPRSINLFHGGDRFL